MTCRTFQHLWQSRSTTDLPPAAREHLTHCTTCAAMAGDDRSTDSFLRRVAATQPAPDLDLARARLSAALADAAPSRRIEWRRPFAFAAVGLTAAAALSLLVMRPMARREAERGVRTVKAPRSGGGVGFTPRPSLGVNLTPRPPLRRGEGESERFVRLGGPGISSPPSPRRRGGQGGEVDAPTASVPAVDPDLFHLNEGGTPPTWTVAARPAEIRAPFRELEPGSRVVDDLLLLNPVRIAGADDAALGAAAASLESPATDARLQQKVTVHATGERLEDVLGWLSKATGVTLIPNVEVAEERVTLWATQRPLIDVMRDLRHLRGYYWSRARREGSYVYSLWQDMQSRAREEAELERRILDEQRAFEENIRRHIKALGADEAERKRLAKEDPYLVVQLAHPVVRAANQLFAALSPDQQAHLLQARTPSRGMSAGELVEYFSLEYRDGDHYLEPERVNARYLPQGDMLTLRWAEMTPAQRGATAAIIRGLADPRLQYHPGNSSHAARVASGADMGAASVTLFRCGDRVFQGLHARVEFKSGGRDWTIYTNFAVPPRVQKSYSDSLRKGDFKVWEPGQKLIDGYLKNGQGDRERGRQGDKETGSQSPEPRPRGATDPVLDSPVSIAWTLPLVQPDHPTLRLSSGQILSLLHRDLGRPLLTRGAWPASIQRDRGGDPVFRMTNRPLREVLAYCFPESEFHVAGGAVFITERGVSWASLSTIPGAVRKFLEQRTEPLTLDDMVLLARSLSPWKALWLVPYLPETAVDQLVAAHEIVQFYGELAPAQRVALRDGLPFSAMTPPQQAHFLAFAQRHRPFVAPWRIESGSVRLVTGIKPPEKRKGSDEPAPTSSVQFQVRFQEGDEQAFLLSSYPARLENRSIYPPDWVGKPFPFPHTPTREGPLGRPALIDERLRKHPVVLQFSWPFVAPFVGKAPPVTPEASAKTLAERLRGAGVRVADLAIGVPQSAIVRPSDPYLPHLIRLAEAGAFGGEPWNWDWTNTALRHSPTVVVIDRDEIVRAVFEGPSAWNLDAIEKAARAVGSAKPVAAK